MAKRISTRCMVLSSLLALLVLTPACLSVLFIQAGDIFQAGVYVLYPLYSNNFTTEGLIPRLGDALVHTRSFSGHSYPQSACNDTPVSLPSLMSHAYVPPVTCSVGILTGTIAYRAGIQDDRDIYKTIQT